MIEEIKIKVDAAPPSANRIWRTVKNRVVLSSAASSFYALVAASVFCKSVRQVPDAWTYYDVEIAIAPIRRSGDVDNRIKPVLDALTRCRFWDDDKRVASVRCRFLTPTPRGATYIIVRESDDKFGGDAPW